MGILDRVKKPTKKEKTDTTTPTATARPVRVKRAKAEGSSEVVQKPRQGGASALILLAPHVSEKAGMLASKSIYAFDVPLSANKVEIRKAVEALYVVAVERVHVIRGKGKRVRRGRVSGQRSDWKKALVYLKGGQKIDLYAGV